MTIREDHKKTWNYLKNAQNEVKGKFVEDEKSNQILRKANKELMILRNELNDLIVLKEQENKEVQK